MNNPWKIIKKNKIFESQWGHKVRLDEVMTPANKKGNYFVLEGKSYVVMVALTKDKKLIMERVWRYPIEKESWELPVGGIEDGEDILKAAKRELFEETGAKSDKWFNLGWHWVDNGFSDIKGNLFLALDAEMSDSVNPDENEKIEVELCDFDEVLKKVINNEITDLRTKIGMLLANEFLKNEK